jgi:hypothetical protein
MEIHVFLRYVLSEMGRRENYRPKIKVSLKSHRKPAERHGGFMLNRFVSQ